MSEKQFDPIIPKERKGPLWIQNTVHRANELSDNFTGNWYNECKKRHEEFYNIFKELDLTDSEVTSKLIEIIPLGTDMELTVHGLYEGLSIRIEHKTADQFMGYGRFVGYGFDIQRDARILGIIDKGSANLFLKRPIIVITDHRYSKGIIFCYDVISGKRITPISVEGIEFRDDKIGDKNYIV